MKKIALSLAVLAASGAYVWNQGGADPSEALIGLSPAKADTESLAADPALPAEADGPAAAASQPSPAVIQPSGPYAPSREPANPPLVTASIAVPSAPAASTPAPLPESQPAPMSVEAVPAPSAPVADLASVIAPAAPRPRPRPRLLREVQPLVMKASMTVAASGGYTDGTFTGPTVDAYYGMVQIQAIVRGGRLASIKVLQYPSDRRTSVAINRQALPMLRDEAIAAQSANVDIVSGATLTSEAFARSLKGALQRAMA
ncbi:FMN-binding domain-containing protein [Kaistia algarum]|uniref:FMN-binding protein n=1 Tax=Kaistia algarum TaxID=2083279 RepID=UPI000CE89402|nr:FMN-binding protein [Kaistia algarum]MCX5515336.1 FMN-binding protein [Kaistia algarum]PPE77890.1 FMN-binding domain-containing protein [Kaistia algarum]